MSSRKLPPVEAFTYYISLGMERSYTKVAEKFSCSHRAVVSLAVKECWQQKLLAQQAEAMQNAEQALAAQDAGFKYHHIAIARAMLEKAAQALPEMQIERMADLVRLIEAAVKVELLAREMPHHRVALEIKRELELRERSFDGEVWTGRHHARNAD